MGLWGKCGFIMTLMYSINTKLLCPFQLIKKCIYICKYIFAFSIFLQHWSHRSTWIIFSCDQAALWMVFSICVSVCLSVRLSHLFHYVPIIVSSWNFQELLLMTKVRCLTAPSHYLNQCWLIISKVEWHSSKGKFTRVNSAINHWNYLEN